MARAMAVVDRIEPWNDGLGDEWRSQLPKVVSGAEKVGIELDRIHPSVRDYIDSLTLRSRIADVSPVVSGMRMIKSQEELALARHAGEVAGAMMKAGRATIDDGVAEYEVALATSTAGTRKAAELLKAHYDDQRMSPNTHFL